MKKYIYIFLLVLLIPFTSLNSATKYLMDPMPANDRAPEFTLMGMDEKTHTLKSLEGRFLLVNFWATWCYPCRLEIPDLNKMQEEYEDFIILGISISDSKKQLEDFSKLYDVRYPLLYGSSKEIDKITIDYGGVYAVPTSILINKKGEQVFAYPGAILEQNDRFDGVFSTLKKKLLERIILFCVSF